MTDSVHYLAYPSLFQLMLKSLTDRHTVLLDVLICSCDASSQRCLIINYNDIILFCFEAHTVLQQIKCATGGKKGDKERLPSSPFLQLHIIETHLSHS